MKYSETDESRRDKNSETEKSMWRRINILDIVFIVALLFIALVIASFFTSFSLFGIGGEQRTISYTVEFDNVKAGMAESIKIGDKVFDASGKRAIGVVTAIKSSDAVRYMYNSEVGLLETVKIPADASGKTPQTVKVTIQVTADYNAGDGYSVNGNRISAGTSIELCFAGYTGEGSCVSVYGVTGTKEASK